MNKHTISLSGPWMARTFVAGEIRTMRLNIKSSADWNGWQNATPYSGELILERKFNWLFPEPAPERIELQLKCRVAPHGVLNKQAIALRGIESVFSADVTCFLKPSNRLELRFQLEQMPGADPVLEWVELHSFG